MFQYSRLYQEGVVTLPRVGDRLVYDESNGTLIVQRDDAELMFAPQEHASPTARLFVGKAWTRKLTRASAELYARLGGLEGTVEAIEGSYSTLHVYEIVG
ncbi:MAG: hypothetical protein HYS27_19735 [Deltaproteobacteria bacterium]|nr:hypothetical protein [Deltaproteobacteria bacterium]